MCCFFFNDTATTEIYTLSLHDALPIYEAGGGLGPGGGGREGADDAGTEGAITGITPEDLELEGEGIAGGGDLHPAGDGRSEEHTSELQSRQYLVCRLLLEKKKKISIAP